MLVAGAPGACPSGGALSYRHDSGREQTAPQDGL